MFTSLTPTFRSRATGIASAVAALVLAGSSLAQAAPAAPANFSTRDTSALPVVYLAGANDMPALNKDIAKNVQDAGMQFFAWYPLLASVKDKSISLYDNMEAYSASVDAFVKGVLQKTGAPQVNIVTYSQSGLINQTWMKKHGGARYVAKVINYSGLLQGSPFGAIATNVTGDCLGFGTCVDFDPWGQLVTDLNKHGEAAPGVIYYNITSKYDEMAMPYQVNFMYAHTGNYMNVLLQDYCPANKAGHLMLPHASATRSITLQAIKGQPLNPKC